MNLAEAAVGQLLIPVDDLEKAVAFYRDILGLRFLFTAPPQMAFFECGGVRLLVGVPPAGQAAGRGGAVYFRVADIRSAFASLRELGVSFIAEPHVVNRTPSSELWLAEFTDPDGNHLALMSDIPTSAPAAMKIAFVGHGRVGFALAHRLRLLGHEVTLAAADPSSASLRQALERDPGLRALPPRDAIADAEVVFLATPFPAIDSALPPLAALLAGKILVDCTNPVGPELSHSLGSTRSGSEAVQALAPLAKVVKAFSIYGFENFEDNAYPGYGVRPAMLYCGDDAPAKAIVGRLIEQLGWEAVDTGPLKQALHLEHMTLLWVRMVRSQGRSPAQVWAKLTRK